MIDKPFRITCEMTSSKCCCEDEGEFTTYGVRARTDDGRIIYEFKDILPDKRRVERFVALLNKHCTPITHLHFAVMDFLQAL